MAKSWFIVLMIQINSKQINMLLINSKQINMLLIYIIVIYSNDIEMIGENEILGK